MPTALQCGACGGRELGGRAAGPHRGGVRAWQSPLQAAGGPFEVEHGHSTPLLLVTGVQSTSCDDQPQGNTPQVLPRANTTPTTAPGICRPSPTDHLIVHTTQVSNASSPNCTPGAIQLPDFIATALATSVCKLLRGACSAGRHHAAPRPSHLYSPTYVQPQHSPASCIFWSCQFVTPGHTFSHQVTHAAKPHMVYHRASSTEGIPTAWSAMLAPCAMLAASSAPGALLVAA